MKRAVWVLTLSLFSVGGWAQERTATYFEQGSKKEKKLFISEHKTVPNPEGSGEIGTSVYKDLDGQVLHQEKVWLNGVQVVKVEVEQKQLGQAATIEVKDGRVYFTKTADGKTKKSDEKLGDTFVVPGAFQRFVATKWPEILEGKNVDFRFGVWDRMETVGFRIFKVGEEELAGQKAVVLKMKPSSFLIAALVNPLYFKFAADGSKVLEINGRVPVKKKEGEKFKDLDAEGYYN